MVNPKRFRLDIILSQYHGQPDEVQVIEVQAGHWDWRVKSEDLSKVLLIPLTDNQSWSFSCSPNWNCKKWLQKEAAHNLSHYWLTYSTKWKGTESFLPTMRKHMFMNCPLGSQSWDGHCHWAILRVFNFNIDLSSHHYMTRSCQRLLNVLISPVILM